MWNIIVLFIKLRLINYFVVSSSFSSAYATLLKLIVNLVNSNFLSKSI